MCCISYPRFILASGNLSARAYARARVCLHVYACVHLCVLLDVMIDIVFSFSSVHLAASGWAIGVDGTKVLLCPLMSSSSFKVCDD